MRLEPPVEDLITIDANSLWCNERGHKGVEQARQNCIVMLKPECTDGIALLIRTSGDFWKIPRAHATALYCPRFKHEESPFLVPEVAEVLAIFARLVGDVDNRRHENSDNSHDSQCEGRPRISFIGGSTQVPQGDVPGYENWATTAREINDQGFEQAPRGEGHLLGKYFENMRTWIARGKLTSCSSTPFFWISPDLAEGGETAAQPRNMPGYRDCHIFLILCLHPASSPLDVHGIYLQKWLTDLRRELTAIYLMPPLRGEANKLSWPETGLSIKPLSILTRIAGQRQTWRRPVGGTAAAGLSTNSVVLYFSTESPAVVSASSEPRNRGTIRKTTSTLATSRTYRSASSDLRKRGTKRKRMKTTSTLATSRTYLSAAEQTLVHPHSEIQTRPRSCARPARGGTIYPAEQGTTSATGSPNVVFVPLSSHVCTLVIALMLVGQFIAETFDEDPLCTPSGTWFASVPDKGFLSSMASLRKSLSVVDPGRCWPAQRRGNSSDVGCHVVRTQRDAHLFGHRQAGRLTFPSASRISSQRRVSCDPVIPTISALVEISWVMLSVGEPQPWREAVRAAIYLNFNPQAFRHRHRHPQNLPCEDLTRIRGRETDLRFERRSPSVSGSLHHAGGEFSRLHQSLEMAKIRGRDLVFGYFLWDLRGDPAPLKVPNEVRKQQICAYSVFEGRCGQPDGPDDLGMDQKCTTWALSTPQFSLNLPVPSRPLSFRMRRITPTCRLAFPAAAIDEFDQLRFPYCLIRASPTVDLIFPVVWRPEHDHS
ncbi:hypothetical protein C8R44DRAFT_916557 [Mycena epipterygia]|nr:hypothetical protein C8R44DRAFT_916557 [Mycena epipterygia]